MSRKFVSIICIIIAVASSIVTWIITTQVYVHSSKSTELRISEESYDELSSLLDLVDLKGLINQYYYEDVEDQTLIDGSMKGMVNSLNDPYSAYYTEEEYKEYLQASDGTYVGIGLTFVQDGITKNFIVVRVNDDSPAAEAGIEAGDIITAIDGIKVSTLEMDSASDLLKGPAGSSVTLTISRDGIEQDYTLTRAELENQFVYYTMYGDICYVIIQEFHGDVSADFAKALNFADEENARGMVIDLRNNSGGIVREAVEIADQILPEGLIVYTEDKYGNRNEYKSDADYNDIPVAVLVNSLTASSSEILAAAVQDHSRGSIVGTQTFGKGVVQSIIDMPYSGGGVKLTTAVYYTPSGKSINGVGVTPDYVVELPDSVLTGEDSLKYDNDTQLQTAMELLGKE